MLSISLPTMFLINTASVILPLLASNVVMVRPSLRTVTVSAIEMTSFNLCEINTQVTPWCLRSRNKLKRFSASSVFSADVGSSRINSLTSLLNALAISTNCLFPTLKSFTLTAGFTLSFTFFKISPALLIVSFQSTMTPLFNSWPRKIFSYTDISGTSANSW